MSEKDWIYVMDDSRLPEGAIAAVYPKGVNILLAKVLGKVYALDGKCAHMGCPLFCSSISGHIITCPCHDWRYDLLTGEFIDSSEIKLRAYAVKAENGRLFVSLT
ncbi:MAG: Rieske (2Fe-2S) protein [Deltaproteobacteria bacterium]|nr:Rieske (2Fe-2S) protein [Deltaproteobacteria bacterium]